MGDTIINPGALRNLYVSHVNSVTPGGLCSPNPSVAISRSNQCIYFCTGTWSAAVCSEGAANGYSQDITAVTSVVLTHNLSTRNLVVACYNSSEQLVEPDQVQISSSPPYDVTVS